MKLTASNLALKQRPVIVVFIRALLLLIVNSSTHIQTNILFQNKDLAPYPWILKQSKKIFFMMEIIKIRCRKEIESIKYSIFSIALLWNKIWFKQK